jgi:GNAT superfamily N-acetyltransferase
MPQIDVTVTCPVFDSFRVQQVGGMFDVPISERASERFRLDLPQLGEQWRIGLIVGPSGSGKSTVARKIFGDSLYQCRSWPQDRAVVDCMGELPIKEIVRLFTAVGFGSPPSWIKPYHVLSGGEKFRCDLARALATAKAEGGKPKAGEGKTDSPVGSPLSAFHFPVVAFDEFTSVVDRNVARIASAAIAKAIRRGTVACRFVAVTCHYDVTEWLEPDWVIDMATAAFTRRCLQRPRIDVEVFRCRGRAWRLFARHHYMSGSLSPAAQCFLALWEKVPVAFCATLPLIARKNRFRISRIVTLPDYQGVGIGTALMETVAELHRRQGHRVNCTASHPAVIAHWRKSPRWKAISVKKTGSPSARHLLSAYRSSLGRAVVSAEYVGSAEAN